ncbi:hypothetical protein N1851_009254 [Merluccius polli]|uniref:Uncharacterized protein n=1 Tax=Merluccius polli TaxID=89951 RepID=A0AA47N185_MERPO|nr:hypothetical protein N1851_009254 [Merluccius polli]
MADHERAETDGNAGKDHKRAVKYTAKAIEEKLHKQMNARKRTLSRLTNKMKNIESLMENYDTAYIVEKDHLSDYSKLLSEFIQANNAICLLLQDDDEREADQLYWFLPNLVKCQSFLAKTEKWIVHVRRQAVTAPEEIIQGVRGVVKGSER